MVAGCASWRLSTVNCPADISAGQFTINGAMHQGRGSGPTA